MSDISSNKGKLVNLFDELTEFDNLFVDLIDISSPLQLEVFWVESPIECQYIAITHDDNRDNNEAIINGPFSGSEFLDQLEGVLLKPRWQQPVNKSSYPRFDPATGVSSDISTRRDAAINFFQGIEQQLGREVFKQEDTQVRGGERLDHDNWLFFVRGNLLELDSAEDLLENMFGDLSSREEDNEGEKEIEEDSEGEKENEEEENTLPSEESNAFGTYIYEPVWVGGTPELDFKDRVLIDPPLEYDTVHSAEIGEQKVVITKDGFVGIDEPNNKAVVLDILNTMFGTSILIEHPFEAATRDDLIEIAIDEDGDITNRTGSPSTRRRHATPEPWMNSKRNRHRGPPVERKLIDEKYLEDLCSLTKDIYEDGQMKERINSTLQAYTHHVNGEYTQAFLLAWISIEQYINDKLDKYLKENKGVNSDRRRNMQRGGHWSASHLIELMEVSDCISGHRYEKITNMRKRRNEIVHDTDSANVDESKEIVNLSFNLIDEQLSDEEEDTEFVL